MSTYILNSLIALREEITERLMQNSEFRALQSLQRSIDEVSELARRDQDPAVKERATSQQQRMTPATLVRDFNDAEDAQRAETIRQANISRVTPAHFATAKRVI